MYPNETIEHLAVALDRANYLITTTATSDSLPLITSDPNGSWRGCLSKAEAEKASSLIKSAIASHLIFKNSNSETSASDRDSRFQHAVDACCDIMARWHEAAIVATRMPAEIVACSAVVALSLVSRGLSGSTYAKH